MISFRFSLKEGQESVNERNGIDISSIEWFWSRELGNVFDFLRRNYLLIRDVWSIRSGKDRVPNLVNPLSRRGKSSQQLLKLYLGKGRGIL